jgi:hypothetical protein
MAVQLILKNSSVEDKRPTANQLANGEISLNYNEAGAFLCCTDTNGDVQQVGGVKIDETAPDAPVKQTLWFQPSTLMLSVFDGDKWLPIGGSGDSGGGGSVLPPVPFLQIIGNDGIDADTVSGIVTLDVELAGGDDGLEFKSSKLSASVASDTQLGSVKIGDGIDVTADGTISFDSDAAGLKPDEILGGDGIEVTPGTDDVTIDVDLAPNKGLEFIGGQLAAEIGGGLQFNPDGSIGIDTDIILQTGDITGGEAIKVTDGTGTATIDVDLLGGQDGLEIRNDKLTATVATASTLGSVKIGSGIDVTVDGTISFDVDEAGLQPDEVLGGDGIEITAGTDKVTIDVDLAGGQDGLEFKSNKLSATTASTTDHGVVKVGENIDVTDGEISVPKATTSTFGVVKLGIGIEVDGDGSISIDFPATTTYRGSCNLNNPPTGQINPDPALKADAYINSADSAAVAAGWTGITGTAKIGDLVIFDGTIWELIPLGSGEPPVTSVNGRTGDVVLDYTDVGAASEAQGDLADSALQPGDNISELNNNVGYITEADLDGNYLSLAADAGNQVVLSPDETSFMGNVGIGMDNPQSALDVNGDIKASGSAYSKSTVASDLGTTLVTKDYVDASGVAPGDGALTIKTAGQGSNATGTFTANQPGASTLTLPVIRYGDLSGTPSIGNGTITIKQPGTADQTFTVNQTGPTTISLKNDNTQNTPGNGALTIKTAGQGSNATGTFTADQSGASTLTLPTIRYGDLSGAPSIPAAAGNGTITVTQPGTSAQTFTVNQSGNTTIALKNDNTQNTPGNGTITVVQPGTSNQTFSVNQTGNTTITLKNDNTSTTPGNGALTIKTAGQGSNATGTFTANQGGASTLTLPVIRYGDLSGRPSIPAAAGNGTITIKQPGTTDQTFTVNQTGNSTINLKNDNTQNTPGNGQIWVAAGTGLNGSGDQATANQTVNTTRTLSLDTTYTDGRYVKKSGDNMTGDLTLGPVGSPVIALDATGGFGRTVKQWISSTVLSGEPGDSQEGCAMQPFGRFAVSRASTAHIFRGMQTNVDTISTPSSYIGSRGDAYFKRNLRIEAGFTPPATINPEYYYVEINPNNGSTTNVSYPMMLGGLVADNGNAHGAAIFANTPGGSPIKIYNGGIKRNHGRDTRRYEGYSAHYTSEGVSNHDCRIALCRNADGFPASIHLGKTGDYGSLDINTLYFPKTTDDQSLGSVNSYFADGHQMVLGAKIQTNIVGAVTPGTGVLANGGTEGFAETNMTFDVMDSKGSSGGSNTLKLNSKSLIVNTINGITLHQPNQGIVFTDNGDSELTYEEGSWKPTILVGGTEVIPGTQAGYYTKIGKQVYVVGRVQTIDLAGKIGKLNIANLPFQVSDNAAGNVTDQGAGQVTLYKATGAPISYGAPFIRTEKDAFSLYVTYMGAGTLNASSNDLEVAQAETFFKDTSCQFRFTCTYICKE